jgi:hypothetical protein
VNGPLPTASDSLASTAIGPFEDFRIDVLGPDAAVVSWHDSVTETYRAGARRSDYVALMTQVWVREGSEWRILHNHESTRPVLETP